MEITTDLVKHLATLSRLKFTDAEIESFKDEFAKTLEHVEEIAKVDTSEVELRCKGLDAKEELRQDTEITYLTQDEVVKNAPKKTRGMIVVPSIVE